MVNKCENCGQTVMATDSECWHCGSALTPQNQTEVLQPERLTAVSQDTVALPPIRTILLYAGLTAVSLLLLILTTRVIGQAPLLRFGGGNTLLVGWQPVTDSQLQFTLNLPETWQAIDLAAASEANSVWQSPPVQSVSATFTALVADSELLLLGTEDTAVLSADNPVFVLVAQSQRLQLLSVEQFINYAQQQLPQDVEIVETTVSIGDSGMPEGNLLFDLAQQTDIILRCQEQFILTETEAYLVAACANANQFSDHVTDFETILRSFQPLDS